MHIYRNKEVNWQRWIIQEQMRIRYISWSVKIVWVTISMEERGETEGWYTRSGEYVDWSIYDHGAVLIGYTQDTVTIADPISGKMEYSREDFERVFASRGNQCVILQS